MADSTQVQRRRGTSGQIAAMTPALGEVVYNTTTKTLHTGDGTTAGGTPLAKLDSPAFTGNPTAPTPSPGDSDTSVATTAFVQAAIAAIPPTTGMPAAVTGTLSGHPVAFAVDFSSYSAYSLVIAEGNSSNLTSTLTIEVSTNGGVSYTALGVSGFGATGSAFYRHYVIAQPSASGAAYAIGEQLGEKAAVSAAVNRIRIGNTNGYVFTGGSIILQPLANR